MPKPRIEIAGYRDPDGELYLTVVGDGETATPDLERIVDPGRGGPHSPHGWAVEERVAIITEGASPAWVAAIREYLGQAQEAGHMTDGSCHAINAQPGTPDADLDPQVWIGDGVFAATEPGTGLVWDNTARAGMALRAVHASATLPTDTPDATRAAAALCAHLGIDPALWAGVDADTHTQVAHLLADLMHLADARDLDIGSDLGSAAADESNGILHPQIVELNQALRTASTQDWADLLSQSWPTIAARAIRRHQAQVLGTRTGVRPA